jgi:hypothetical protein
MVFSRQTPTNQPIPAEICSSGHGSGRHIRPHPVFDGRRCFLSNRRSVCLEIDSKFLVDPDHNIQVLKNSHVDSCPVFSAVLNESDLGPTQG